MKKYDVTFRYVVSAVAASEQEAKVLACDTLSTQFNEQDYQLHIYDVREGNYFNPLKNTDDFDVLVQMANRLDHEGWVLAECDRGGDITLELQRLEDAGIFSSDEEALDFVINKATENLDGLHSEVLKWMFGNGINEERNIISGVAGWVRIKKLIDHWKI